MALRSQPRIPGVIFGHCVRAQRVGSLVFLHHSAGRDSSRDGKQTVIDGAVPRRSLIELEPLTSPRFVCSLLDVSSPNWQH